MTGGAGTSSPRKRVVMAVGIVITRRDGCVRTGKVIVVVAIVEDNPARVPFRTRMIAMLHHRVLRQTEHANGDNDGGEQPHDLNLSNSTK